MRKLIPKNFPKYAIIGILSVAIDVYVFYMLHDKVGLDKFISTAISISLGLTNSFLLNAFFNFKLTDRLFMRFLKFYAVGILGITLSSIIIFILSDLGGIIPLLSKFISIPPVVAVQFLLNTKFSFSSNGNLTEISPE